MKKGILIFSLIWVGSTAYAQQPICVNCAASIASSGSPLGNNRNVSDFTSLIRKLSPASALTGLMAQENILSSTASSTPSSYPGLVHYATPSINWTASTPSGDYYSAIYNPSVNGITGLPAYQFNNSLSTAPWNQFPIVNYNMPASASSVFNGLPSNYQPVLPFAAPQVPVVVPQIPVISPVMSPAPYWL